MVASNLILCVLAIFSSTQVDCRMRKFRVMVMRDSTSSRDRRGGGNNGSNSGGYGYGSTGGGGYGPSDGGGGGGGESMIMKMDDTGDMSGNSGDSGKKGKMGGGGMNAMPAGGYNNANNANYGNYGNGRGNPNMRNNVGNNRSAYGQQVSSNTGSGYMAASSEGTRYNNGPRMGNNQRGYNNGNNPNFNNYNNYNNNHNNNQNNNQNNNNHNNNQNNNQNNNNHNNNQNNQNQEDGGDGGGDQVHGVLGQEGSFSGDEFTGAKESAEYQPIAAGQAGNEGNEKLIVVMKNDASALPVSSMPQVMAHSLPMSPQLSQAAPVFDSCFVPVNVCNTNNMMGGYGMGGMYGMNGMGGMANMNGMTMNGLGMNAYSGMGFAGYGGMPVNMMNMYG